MHVVGTDEGCCGSIGTVSPKEEDMLMFLSWFGAYTTKLPNMAHEGGPGK